jgi:hypothetical protein
VFEAVNGVPIAMKHEVVAAVKGEPVEVRGELKWSLPLRYGLRCRLVHARWFNVAAQRAMHPTMPRKIPNKINAANAYSATVA